MNVGTRGNPTYAALPTTIFEKMSSLARETGAINLGQGFPDAPGPADVLQAAADALLNGSNQYPSMFGTPELRQAIAAHYRHHQALDLDWASEVIVTSGATEALAAAIFGLVSPGDEVLLIQPLYDAYLPLVERAGGTAKLIDISPPDWQLDAVALAQAIGPKTRVLILNNPVNPAASMWTREDLTIVAEACVRHDVIAICDEVWEHVVFEGEHIPLMALPGMRERTVKIGSAGKIFALTGWKVGWMLAAPVLASVLAKAHQFLTFTTPPNLQAAVAQGLGKPDDWFEAIRAGFASQRDTLEQGLRAAGFVTLPSRATWFLSIDLRASGIALDDETFAERMIREGGVATIPMSAFYARDPLRSIVRLCFTKQPETIERAIERFATMRERL
jgi:N-succinyldiaminopimelate aminotransferase